MVPYPQHQNRIHRPPDTPRPIGGGVLPIADNTFNLNLQLAATDGDYIGTPVEDAPLWVYQVQTDGCLNLLQL